VLILKQDKRMSQKNSSKKFYALSLAWQLGFLISVPIVGFLLLGLLADRFFHTQPVLLVVGLAVGLAVTIYEVYHLLAPLIYDNDNEEK
jgi:F0F1-type ATP synthase assembly protein I